MTDSEPMGAQAVTGDRVYGVVPAVVADNSDPQNLGRVRLRLPWLGSDDMTSWARVVTPMAGKARGIFFLPQVGDEVLVMFQFGNVDHPYVIGGLWSAADAPPAEANEGQATRDESPDAAPQKRSVDRCVIRTVSGHVITLDDTEGKEKVTVVDRTGKNKIEIDSKENKVSITSEKDLAITAKGNIRLGTDGGEVSITCKSLKVEATQSYGIKGAQGKVEAQSGLELTCMAGVKINNDGLVVT